ncbi:polysaccharide biosynthesis C-terminal domain-containing protein [Vibrio mimicus]
MNLKKIFTFSIGPLGSAFLGFLTLPLLSWSYDKSVVGQYSLFQAIVSFFLMAFVLGLDMIYMREYNESNKKKLLLSELTLFCILSSLFAFLVFFFFIIFNNVNVDIFGGWIVIFFILASVIGLVAIRFLSVWFRMEDDAITFSLSQLIQKMALLILVVVSFIFDWSKSSIELILIYLVSILLTFSYLFFKFKIITCYSLLNVSNSINAGLLFLPRAIPIMLGSLAYWGMLYFDKLFISYYLDFEELAVYSMATSFSSVGLVLQIIFTTVWSPSVYKSVSEGNTNDLLTPTINKLIVGTLFYIGIVGIFSPLATRILPETYSSIQEILMISMIVPVINVFSEATAIGLHVVRKTGYLMLSSIVACLCNCLGNYLLIPFMGLKGAAISTLLSLLVFALLRTEISYRIWFRFSRLRIYFYLFFTCMIAIVSTYFDVFGIFWFWDTAVWSLFLIFGILLVVFSNKDPVNR